jgi:hypothetical protein
VSMNLLIIFGIAAGCVVAERLWPAMELPRVRAWWGRVTLINAIQLGITILAGETWNRWLNGPSIFHVRAYLPDWASAAVIYLFSTFVYYWWLATGMNRSFSGEVCTRSITRPDALKS